MLQLWGWRHDVAFIVPLMSWVIRNMSLVVCFKKSTVKRDQLSELTNSNFVTFPSIVKGSDGKAFIAIDDRTGAQLWKKKIESTISFINDVGKDWADLNVMGESDYMFTSDDTRAELTENRVKEHSKSDEKL